MRIVWNRKLLFLALQATAAAAFFVPTLQRHKHVVLHGLTPDSWLGSSGPADYYGGSVGPQFDVFTGEPKEKQKKTDGIKPYEWTGGTMEAGFKQQGGSEQLPEETVPPSDNPREPEAQEEAPKEPEEEASQEEAPQEEAVLPTQPEVPFQILNEVGQRMGYAVPSTYEAKPGHHLEAPFEAKNVEPVPEYSTLKQATPAGQPKMIGWAKPVVEKPPTKQQQLDVTYLEQWKREGKERLPPSEGFPIAEFHSEPDQPGEWFYDDAGQSPPAWPSDQKKQIVYSYQDGGSVEGGIGHQPKLDTKSKPKSIAPIDLHKKSQEAEGRLKEKKIPSGHNEEAFVSKPPVKPHQMPQQATPAGQPKMIHHEPKKPVQASIPLGEENGTAPNEVPAGKPKINPPEGSSEPKPSPSFPEQKPGIPPQEVDAKVATDRKISQEQRLPPSEGFPISEFHSQPDQPGEWFYHDVSLGNKRPDWPSLQQQQKDSAFQDSGSVEGGIGHQPKLDSKTTKDTPTADEVVQDNQGASTKGIAPIDLHKKSTEAERRKKQKKIPTSHHEEIFHTKSPEKPHRVPQQATPAGQPKMIGLEKSPKKSAPKKDKVAKDEPESSSTEGTAQIDLPKESTKAEVGKKQKKKPKKNASKVVKDKQASSTKGIAPIDLHKQSKETEARLKEKKIPSGHNEEAFVSKPPEKPHKVPREATPAGQPKMIGVEKPKPVRVETDKTTSPPLAEGIAPQEVDAKLAMDRKLSQEQRQPPSEGFPISEFHSQPDQPGEWFYHDVAHPGQESKQYPFERQMTSSRSSSAPAKAEEEVNEPNEPDGDSTISA